ncbi:MAG: hypothetical protein K9J25_06695 [Bacteroidales bacterium]|nr:hypothetical protein [Bacteroidales bacterium]
MKNRIIILVIIIMIPSFASAQLWKLRRYEITAGIGTTQFFGDIGGFSKGENLLGFKDITIKQTRFNVNAGFKYRVHERISLKLNMAMGNFHSTDERGSNIERGFDSRTLFFEPSFIGEFYILKNRGEESYLLMKNGENSSLDLLSLIDIYFFGGFGGLSYSVKPNDLLEPRMTKEKGFTPVIPAGVGANFIFSGEYNFGVEFTGRYTFSDHIDGYTSEYSKSNDLYYFLVFTFTYKLKTGDNGWPKF